MTAQYLDKEKVRKALGSIREHLNREYGPGFDKAVCDMGMQIERGEFDAKNLPNSWVEAHQIGVDDCYKDVEKSLADNDAEIARLKEVAGAYINAYEELRENVYGKDGLINEIAKLKKLTALQEETIDAQGKQLRYKCQMREAFEQREKKVPTAPQPSAVPTSGTGTAPKYGRTLEQKVKDLEIVMDDTRLRTYPGMAKDIGNLTLRVDNLEKGVEISHDRCLRLETAFKSLKEEVNGMSITAENGTIYSLKVKREL